MLFSKNKQNTRKSEDFDSSEQDDQPYGSGWQTASIGITELDDQLDVEPVNPRVTIPLREEAALPSAGDSIEACSTDVALIQQATVDSQAMPSLSSDLSIPAKDDIKRRFGTNVRSALGPGTVIEGTFYFDAPVCIDGTMTGEIQSSSILIVGAQAEVNARIDVGGLIVLGKVIGTVNAEQLVELRKGGELKADVKTNRLVIEDGASFNGHCFQNTK